MLSSHQNNILMIYARAHHDTQIMYSNWIGVAAHSMAGVSRAKDEFIYFSRWRVAPLIWKVMAKRCNQPKWFKFRFHLFSVFKRTKLNAQKSGRIFSTLACLCFHLFSPNSSFSIYLMTWIVQIIGSFSELIVIWHGLRCFYVYKFRRNLVSC